MIKLSRLFIFTLAATLLLASYLPFAFAQQNSGYVPGEILIKYKQHVKESRIREIQSKWGLRTKKAFRRFGMRHVTLPEGMSVEDAKDILRNDPDVEYVEPNYRRHPQETIPNDPDFDKLWGLNKIDAPKAWDLFEGSSATVIAVIDTGVDYNHEDLAGTIWINTGEIPENGVDDDDNGYIDDVHGWDFYENDNKPLDNDNHGTHVSGTIAAEMNNSIGISGVSPGARIMALRFMDGDGSVIDEIEAITYAIDNGAKVINMSFGSYTFSISERRAISDAGQEGILFFAAAGNDNRNNDGSSSLYPASYDLSNIISVAATDQNDWLWDDSNYGAISVDVGAPGVNIYSTTPGNNYSYKNGTSMATPHVAGLAALVWGFDPGLTHLQVRDVIFATVDPLASLNGITTTGGRINAYNALAYTLPEPPKEPENLGAATGSSSSITLTWSYDSADETGFIIERRETGNGLYEEIGAVPLDTEMYRDTGLHEGTSYSYRVFAYNAGGRSDYSNEAEATTNPAAPTNFAIEETSSSQLSLSWTDTSSKEEGFTIERKTEGKVFVEVATLPLNTETYDDQGLKHSTTYEYRVRAYKDDNYSSYSSEESATTLAGGGGGGGSCFITSVISQ